MNEKLPYEEQLTQAWDHLPLPDKDMAWKDMKRRLEEDDDDKIMVPPPRRGCGPGVLLVAILFLAGFWLLVRPEKWFIKKDTATSEQIKADSSSMERDKVKIETKIKEGSGISDSSGSASSNTSKPPDDQNQIAPKLVIETKDARVKNTKTQSGPLTIKQESEIRITDATTKRIKRKKALSVKTSSNDQRNNTHSEANEKPKSEGSVSDQQKKADADKNLTDGNNRQEIDSTIQKVRDETKPDLPVKDTAVKRGNTINVKKDTLANASKPIKQKQKDKRPIFFSAGVGLHQQIPIGGQEWTTYGSLGRKGILTDYIPSINFRMEKQDRWFLQTEFRFGAPQHTKQLTYEQVSRIDTPTQSVITTSAVLKKTFYHQVPLSFNYYLLKNWSVGAGVQWNKFYSAVAEEDITKRSPGSQTDTLIGKSILKVSKDSLGALARSWWQGSFQTQYQWRRFSIGARYSFGLEPYIRFSLPGQPLRQEKNSSLQIFLRYELWRSKK